MAKSKGIPFLLATIGLIWAAGNTLPGHDLAAKEVDIGRRDQLVATSRVETVAAREGIVALGSRAGSDAGARAEAQGTLPKFILGIQASGSATATYLPELGVHWTRFTIGINQVIPEIPDPYLTLAEVEDNEAMVDALIDSTNWTSLDNWLGGLASAGIDLFPVVGLGWEGCYAKIDGENATPDRLGADTYLAYMYLYVRAVVERYDGDGYKDADGLIIKYWQIENELNQAMLTAVWGWREPSWMEGLTSLWADWGFLTDLLDTLNRAVHDADPFAETTQNLHTDIPPEYNHLFGMPGWPDAAVLWRDLMDIVGFDAYPNYYYAEPINGTVVGERAATLVSLARGKPVIAMEVGYPSGPTELGYSQEYQAIFLDEAFHSALEAGVSGYFHFKLVSSETHSVEISETDKEILQTVAELFEAGRAGVLIVWALQNIEYIQDHFLDLLQAVEGYWGLVTPEGERKPSFYTMQSIADEVQSLNGE